jgi:hypothetical protein
MGHGFALGGGSALIAYHVIDRETHGLDNYCTSDDPAVYASVETASVRALTEAGYVVTVPRRLDWFRQLDIVDPADPSIVLTVDLGIMPRTSGPVEVADVGLVLDLHDVMTSKLDALIDRHAGRDYRDADSMLQGGHWSISGMCDYVARRRPDVPLAKFVQILRQVDDFVPPSELAEISPAAATELTQRVHGYADEVAALAGNPKPSR